jgi:hypothetical protein
MNTMLKTSLISFDPPAPSSRMFVVASDGSRNARPGADEAYYAQCYELGQKIEPGRVAEIYYRFTARFLAVGNAYKIYELLHVDASVTPDMVFLSRGHRLPGVIIPGSFNKHKAKLDHAARWKRKGVGAIPKTKQNGCVAEAPGPV